MRRARFIVALLVIALPGLCQSSADLLITMAGPDSAAAGATVSYTIGVQNLGPDSATNVTLTDNIPAGMNFVSFTQNSGPAFSCATGPAVICTIASLTFGSSATFTMALSIPVQSAAGTAFTNIATVTAENDATDENNTAAVVTTVPAPFADVSVQKSAPATALAGSNVTYTIVVRNNGPSSAANVSLSDTLPGAMTFVMLSQSGAVFSCSTPAVGAGGTVMCSIASLPSGGVATFTLVGNIPAGTAAGAYFDNTATVSSNFDPAPENDFSSTSTLVASTDLALIMSGPASASAGSDVAYTITVTNPGSGIAESVVVTDPLPAGTTFVSLTSNSGPFSCATPAVGAPGTVTCGASNFAPGTAVLTLVLRLGGLASVSNTATVSSATADPNAANNSSTVTTTVTPSADVSVTKTAAAGAAPGTALTYTIAVTNAGPSNATSVSLSDTLPAGATFTSLTQNSGPTFNCATGASVTCTIASLASGASANFSLVVNVGAVASLSNTATVGSSTTDPTPANNTATATTLVTGTADVSVLKSGPGTAAVGGTVSYTITISNLGPSAASAVSLTDALPSNLTFASITQTSGPTFTCSGGGAVACNIAALAAGATAVFNLVTNVANGTVGSAFTNTAVVSSTSADPNSANNSSTTAPATIAVSANLSVTKTAASTISPGQTISYTITVTNSGPSAASTVSLAESVPLKTTFVSMAQTSGPSFSCTNPAPGASTGASTCALASLASGGTAVFTYVVRVDASAAIGSVIANSVTIGSATTDPASANNTATASVDVTAMPTIPTISGLAGLVLVALLAGMALRLIRKSAAYRM